MKNASSKNLEDALFQRRKRDLNPRAGFPTYSLVKELREEYPALFRELCTASDVRSASDAVLTQFERPADMSEAVKVKRASFAEEFLREFGGGTVVTVPDLPDIMEGVLTLGGKSYAVKLNRM